MYVLEPAILFQEIDLAITYIKNNKAPVPDGITAKFLKSDGEKTA